MLQRLVVVVVMLLLLPGSHLGPGGCLVGEQRLGACILNHQLPLLCIAQQCAPVWVRFERLDVAQDPEGSLGTRDGHVHAPCVCKETDAGTLAACCTHAREDDDVHLLALEAVHRLNGDLFGIDVLGPQESVERLPQELELRPVRCDHGDLRQQPFVTIV